MTLTIETECVLANALAGEHSTVTIRELNDIRNRLRKQVCANNCMMSMSICRETRSSARPTGDPTYSGGTTTRLAELQSLRRLSILHMRRSMSTGAFLQLSGPALLRSVSSSRRRRWDRLTTMFWKLLAL